jgi:soluble lytic murein transglycosylase
VFRKAVAAALTAAVLAGVGFGAPAEAGATKKAAQTKAAQSKAAKPEPAKADPTKAALDAITAGNWSVVDAEMARIKDPLARKIVTWYGYSERRDGGGAPFDEITAFLRANPDWPLAARLRLRAEAAPVAGLSDADIVAWFTQFPPLSTDGAMLEIDALRRLGRAAEAQKLIRATWINGRFAGRDDLAFLKRYDTTLTPADHVARLDTLLWQGAHGEARDLLATGLVPEPAAAVGRARLVIQGSRGLSADAEVTEALDKVPAASRDTSSLRYDLARYYRQSQQDDKVVEILKSPTSELDHPKRWWTERGIQVRRLLREGDPQGAYALARDHKQTADGDFAEAEWLAGWIALRFVKNPAQAREHFQRLAAVASYPVSKARAAYWQGRAAQELGDAAAANRFYIEATSYPTTFYGQFAGARLGRVSFVLPASVEATPAERAAFDKKELVRAARLLGRVGADEVARPFIAELFRAADTPGEALLAGKLAADLHHPELAVRGFKFSKRPLDVALAIGYPMIDVPGGLGAERALILGLIRQESEFYAKAVSPAGARGLMQLMPQTAQRTAKSLKIGFFKNKLTDDPHYNLRLGSAHLAELIADWQGSYVLALASYNAGSGAVRRWIEANGDPRGASDDEVIDWIESIPYSETRNYVQRVLEAFQVYRTRLGDTRLAVASLGDNWQGPPSNVATSAGK